jgi:hypothetical protein
VVRAIGDEGNKIQLQMQEEIADYTEHGQLVGGIYASIWQGNERCTLAHCNKILEVPLAFFAYYSFCLFFILPHLGLTYKNYNAKNCK